MTTQVENTQSPTLPQLPPPVVLLHMLSGMMTARALQVAARLGIADYLKDTPKSVTDLAAVTGTDAPSLYRLLRALASQGIFSEVGEMVFGQSPLSHFLRSDVPGSMRDMARMWGDDWRWATWGELAYSIETGQPAFDHLYGKNLWQYFGEDNNTAGHLFSTAMTSFSEAVNQPIVEAYDFSVFQQVVDVGGGHGSLLQTILAANPELQGILFDLPPVIKSAKASFQAAGLENRTTLVGGDFFQEIPPDADAYALKFILHNWSDATCIGILQNCRDAMRPDSRLLIVEQIIPAGNAEFFGKILDLEMLVVLAGKERTAAEFKDLLEEAGFKLNRILPTHSPFSIIEALPDVD